MHVLRRSIARRAPAAAGLIVAPTMLGVFVLAIGVGALWIRYRHRFRRSPYRIHPYFQRTASLPQVAADAHSQTSHTPLVATRLMIIDVEDVVDTKEPVPSQRSLTPTPTPFTGSRVASPNCSLIPTVAESQSPSLISPTTPPLSLVAHATDEKPAVSPAALPPSAWRDALPISILRRARQSYSGDPIDPGLAHVNSISARRGRRALPRLPVLAPSSKMREERERERAGGPSPVQVPVTPGELPVYSRPPSYARSWRSRLSLRSLGKHRDDAGAAPELPPLTALLGHLPPLPLSPARVAREAASPVSD